MMDGLKAACNHQQDRGAKGGPLLLTCNGLQAVASGTKCGVHRGHFQVAAGVGNTSTYKCCDVEETYLLQSETSRPSGIYQNKHGYLLEMKALAPIGAAI